MGESDAVERVVIGFALLGALGVAHWIVSRVGLVRVATVVLGAVLAIALALAVCYLLGTVTLRAADALLGGEDGG